jgi:hypothetical protein
MFNLRGCRFEPVTLTVSQTLWCPVHRKDASAECRVAPWDNRLLDVERCSACVPATNVICGKACLSQGRERPGRLPS